MYIYTVSKIFMSVPSFCFHCACFGLASDVLYELLPE